MKDSYSVVSMFSGCGGMDLGFRGGFRVFDRAYRQLPYKVVWANDLNEAACRTYSRNLKGDILQKDVWKALDTLPRTTDVLAGGFPCQDISVNGKRTGVNGKRSGLYRAMVEAIASTKPRIFVAENVKGLLMQYNKQSLERVMTDFQDLGYDVTKKLYNAADYGIPQVRERVFIVGTARGERKFVPPVPQTALVWMTAEEAIRDLEGVGELEIPNHVWSRANRSLDQGDRRLKADRPAYTIRAECHGNIQFHYRLARRISMREAARFQSFPDNFVFDAKLRETERLVGNAVPPVLAWHVAKAVLGVLKS